VKDLYFEGEPLVCLGPADQDADSDAEVCRSELSVGLAGDSDLGPSGALQVQQAVDRLGVVRDRDVLDAGHVAHLSVDMMSTLVYIV